MDGDRPWLKPAGREARNEQAKLRAALLNAGAITILVTATVGWFVNPALGDLTVSARFATALLGWGLHLLARLAVRGIEDR